MNNKKFYHTYISMSQTKYSTPNTVAIPEIYREFLLKRVSSHKSFSHYIHQLITKYSYLIQQGKIKPYASIKTKYQDNRLMLFPKKFRSYKNSDWGVLKILANCLNVSMCKLVVLLIEFDMIGIEKDIVTTQSFGYQENYYPKISLLIRTIITFTSQDQIDDW